MIRKNGLQPGSRAVWGTSRQQPSPFGHERSGTTASAQQRAWTTPRAPSLAVQAEAAGRQRSLSTSSTVELAELQAAFAMLCEGKDISSSRPAVLEALASPLLRAELEARQLPVAAAGTDPSAQQEPLTERHFVMLTMRPSICEGAAVEDQCCRLLRSCSKQSRKPAESAAAVRATSDLNEAVFDEVASAEGPAAGNRVAALKAALAGCVLQREGGVPEAAMRCKCLLNAVTDSGLLLPNQKSVKVVLPGGLLLDVVRQRDPWEQTAVLMTGVSSAVSLAQASFMVADILKGAPFELSTGSEPRSTVGGPPSGRELMGITIASACSDDQSAQNGERTLYLTVRRDMVSRLPPVASVLVVRPTAVDPAARNQLTWARFVVAANDGHTDQSRCNACGEHEHAAATCPAQHEGHRARFTCFASVPLPQAVASGRQLTHSKKPATANRSQHLAAGADGFAAVTGSQRAVNKQLNQQAHQHPVAVPATGCLTVASDAASVTVTPQQLTVPATPPAGAAVTQQITSEDEPTDDDVIAESEHMEQLRQQGLVLNAMHLELALCLTADGRVAPDHAGQFDNMLTKHKARLTAATNAHAQAAEATAVLNKAPPLISPKGKAKSTAQGAKVYHQQRDTYNQNKAKRETQLKAAGDLESRAHALLLPLQSPMRKLQQYADVLQQRGVTQLLPASIDTSPQLTAGTDSCESLSPLIELPPDSQGAATAATTDTLEVGPEVAAAAHPAHASVQPAVPPDHLHPQVTVTQSAQSEQQRQAHLASQLDAFDRAEQNGVETEQARLLLTQQAARSSPSSPAVRTAVSHAASAHADTSDSELDSGSSCGSQTSEGSSSECSDADTLHKSTVRKQQQQQQQRQQQTVLAPPQATASTAVRTRPLRPSTMLATSELTSQLAARAASVPSALSPHN